MTTTMAFLAKAIIVVMGKIYGGKFGSCLSEEIFLNVGFFLKGESFGGRVEGVVHAFRFARLDKLIKVAFMNELAMMVRWN